MPIGCAYGQRMVFRWAIPRQVCVAPGGMSVGFRVDPGGGGEAPVRLVVGCSALCTPGVRLGPRLRVGDKSVLGPVGWVERCRCTEGVCPKS